MFEAVMRIRSTEGTHTLLHLFLFILLVHIYTSHSLSLPTYLIPPLSHHWFTYLPHPSLFNLHPLSSGAFPPNPYTIWLSSWYMSCQPSLSGSSLPPPPTGASLTQPPTGLFHQLTPTPPLTRYSVILLQLTLL